ncbi:50S ribosomal protein L17 [Bradymonas sediminis]|uniref:50S ribosomal protein L17 n=1 Tax=Bradymonas sediminis TaxID=1548548 RepID=A0A2Z4FGZ4_9DELT|nr:50S ribosomal protein L17 [Bradymonas sediminis]AWV88008.1 50S ribosomal protein L17 [Bradymonas sediminis]
MRHRKSGRKLNMEAAHRKAVLHNMARSLVQYELVQTTDAKAKELRRIADRLITLGKKDTVHARRQARAVLQDPALVGKVFDDLAKREAVASRAGGYSRLVKVGNRKGDNAPITRISWVGSNLENTEALRYPAHIRDLIEAEDVEEETAEA